MFSPPVPPEGAVDGDRSFVEYPYPKEAARYLLHLLSGAGEYAPRLGPVAAPAPPPALPGREPLDPRVARRVRRAMGDLPERAK